MTKMYVVFYDTDFGNREEWNIFYTPFKVFDDPALADRFINEVAERVEEHGVETELRIVELNEGVFDVGEYLL